MGYALMRKPAYGLLDPFVLNFLFVPFSAALLATLYVTHLVAARVLLVFGVGLGGYLLGVRAISAFFDRGSFRRAINVAASSFTRAELRGIFVAALCLTALLAVLGVLSGAAGNARQEFEKVFRPLVLIQGGLFLVTSIVLLSNSFSTSRMASWVVVLTLLTLPFSGKSVFLPIVIWMGLKLFVAGRRLTLKWVALGGVVALAGLSIMGAIAYRSFGPSGAMRLLAYRLWLSGDVYIYAYQLGALAAIRHYYHVSFIGYMLHPIAALVGVHTYKKPLGSMLSSEVTGKNLVTGPNPQLPVLLDFFFPHALVFVATMSFLVGCSVMGLRALCVITANTRSRFLHVGAVAAGVFLPAAGFLDIEQVTIQLVGLIAVCGIGCLADLVYLRGRARRP